MQDTIVILEEGNQLYPRRPHCDMFVSHKALNGCHLTNDLFRQGSERKRHRLLEEEAQAVAEMYLTAYGIPLAPVTSFRYLWRVLSADDYWTEVIRNLWKARRKWSRLTQVLSREGED